MRGRWPAFDRGPCADDGGNPPGPHVRRRGPAYLGGVPSPIPAPLVSRHLLLPALLLAAVLAVPSAGAQSPATGVTFVVDMRAPIEAGWFEPDAERVGVRGSAAPLAWDATFDLADPDGDSLYAAFVPLADTALASVAYKFKVDGADNPNGGWEEGRNRVAAPGDTVRRAFNAPPPEIPPSFTGTFETHEGFASAFLDQPRTLYVYLPPGYADAPERRYPVLYLHDGRGVFDRSDTGDEWRVDETAERLIEAGLVEPLIVVGVSNTPDRTDEYTPTPRTPIDSLARLDPPAALGADPLAAYAGRYRYDAATTLTVLRRGEELAVQLGDTDPLPAEALGDGRFAVPAAQVVLRFAADADGRVTHLVTEGESTGGRGDRYGRMLVEEVKPFIDARYRTLDGPAHTGLGGSSLGGLITLHLGLRYPDVFGRLAVLSPSAWWDDRVVVREVGALPGTTGQRIWLDMGTAEGAMMLDGARALRDALAAKGWREGADLRYVEVPDAAHHETAWAERVEPLLRFLFPAAR